MYCSGGGGGTVWRSSPAGVGVVVADAPPEEALAAVTAGGTVVFPCGSVCTDRTLGPASLRLWWGGGGGWHSWIWQLEDSKHLKRCLKMSFINGIEISLMKTLNWRLVIDRFSLTFTAGWFYLVLHYAYINWSGSNLTDPTSIWDRSHPLNSIKLQQVSHPNKYKSPKLELLSWKMAQCLFVNIKQSGLICTNIEWVLLDTHYILPPSSVVIHPVVFA